MHYQANHLLPKTRSEAGIPLRVVAALQACLICNPNILMHSTLMTLPCFKTLADQIAIAIDNARSYELSQQAVRECVKLTA